MLLTPVLLFNVFLLCNGKAIFPQDFRAVGSDWTYADVNKWGVQFPQFCAGQSNSPIDIDTKTVDKSAIKEEIVFQGYDVKPKAMKVKNNGYTAVVEITADKLPTMEKGGLPGKFVFLQLHFHWGPNGNEGSEHTIDNKKYPLEVHLVHYNMKYPNISEAIKHKDGLAVLGFVYTVGPKNSAPMETLTKAFANVVKKDTVYDMPTPFALADAADPFVDTDKLDFYRYNGGLTTPTCNEVVTWTVVSKPLFITEEQLARFRTLKDKDSGNITTNYRPVQPLNGRKITGFFHDKKTDDDDC